AARRLTFKDCAERYIAAHEPSWANPKHRQQWRNTLSSYAYPEIGDLDVTAVGVGDVMRVIEPLWASKTETASRLRGRIEAILAWAIVRGHREGPNPALWRGHLDALLPPRGRIRPVRHHAALDWRRVPEFMAALRARPAMSARALEFTILTAARSSEVRLARWGEIDLADKLWIVPAARTKMRREHRVPLADRTLELLGALRDDETPDDALIFPSAKPDRPFSDAVYRALYARMGVEGVTTHGFRSAFRDWCGEATNHPREVAEHALAHKAGDAVELAYRRGDALAKRRKLMADWVAYCGGG
ncbi:MAG: site-specific integrase, partial [Maricaulaceae bacterium]